MTRAIEGLARSVQTRLVSHVYRLSASPYAERFVLEGALPLLAWLGETLRPTRDADLLGFGDLSDAALDRIFREVCAVPVAPDG